MALDSDATLVIGTGNFYTAVVDTAIPADLDAPGVAWTNVGHTSLEDIFGISSDGGDPTTVGSLQAATLRTKYSPRTETFTFTAQQFDEETLKLFFGSNSVVAGGLVSVPLAPVVTTAAFLAVFKDGDNSFAFYAPKAEILRADDMSIADAESLAGLPLGIKPVAHGSNGWAYAVTPIGTV